MGSGAPTLDPTTGLPVGGFQTGVSMNSPMGQTANQIGIDAAGGKLNQPSPWRTGLKKAGQIANAWDQAGGQMGSGQQQQAQPVNFNVAPMPFIPPPQMGPGFYGG